MKGICPDCNKLKKLTKHSETGNHKPPFKWKCRECHDKIHGIKEHKHINKKYQRGTKRVHKKNWRK